MGFFKIIDGLGALYEFIFVTILSGSILSTRDLFTPLLQYKKAIEYPTGIMFYGIYK